MVERLIKNKEIVFKNFISAVILFAIFFIEGCFNFLNFKFELERVKDVNFWASVGTRCLLMILVKVLAMTIFLDIARLKNTKLTYEKSKNEKLMKLKDADFPFYINTVKNPDIAIEAWRLKINKKLTKLEKKASRKDRALYYSDLASDMMEKKTNKYCVRRKDYEHMLSDEYIEQNKNCLNVNCQRIDAAGFNVPVNINASENKYQIFAKTKVAIASSLFVASSWLLIMQIVRNALDFSWADSIPLAVAVGLVMDLVFLGYQFFTGIMDSFKIIDQQEVFPYVNRNRILEEYLFYKQPDKKDKIKQLLEKLESTENN